MGAVLEHACVPHHSLRHWGLLVYTDQVVEQMAAINHNVLASQLAKIIGSELARNDVTLHTDKAS